MELLCSWPKHSMDPAALTASQPSLRTQECPRHIRMHKHVGTGIDPSNTCGNSSTAPAAHLCSTLTFVFPFVSPLSVQANSPVSTSPLPALFSTLHRPNIDVKQAGVLEVTSKESLAYIIKSLQVQYSSEPFSAHTGVPW